LSSPLAQPPRKLVVKDAEKGRAYFDSSTKTIHTAAYNSPAISAHEYGHLLEADDKWVQERVAEFKKARFDAARTVRMTEIDPHAGYDPSEVGNPDDLEETFLGDKSRAAYAGKEYSDGMTEIVSMGMELLYHNPVRFAEANPEYFALILSVLQGDRRR